ncbi:unnamed protein product [Spirodela intermedia]|uniref:Integrase catalytic domain-containing protein n=1 Tax=Spirodela intermedia TaxID=51605 RepID=A0A7I8JK34_SPIIN|nr:unnamed protein product [Spirodela intermedia]CAA6670221.1 unnamed protein product [Spirodela intermedia]
MVDGGASHNYICRHLAARLQLPMSKTQPYRITLGDNCTTFCDRVCCDYSHFSLFKHMFAAVDVAAVFSRDIVHLYGFPLSIVIDRGSVFTGAFWRELHALQGTSFKMNSAYHPEMDGQMEV